MGVGESPLHARSGGGCKGHIERGEIGMDWGGGRRVIALLSHPPTSLFAFFLPSSAFGAVPIVATAPTAAPAVVFAKLPPSSCPPSSSKIPIAALARAPPRFLTSPVTPCSATGSLRPDFWYPSLRLRALSLRSTWVRLRRVVSMEPSRP